MKKPAEIYQRNSFIPARSSLQEIRFILSRTHLFQLIPSRRCACAPLARRRSTHPRRRLGRFRGVLRRPVFLKLKTTESFFIQWAKSEICQIKRTSHIPTFHFMPFISFRAQKKATLAGLFLLTVISKTLCLVNRRQTGYAENIVFAEKFQIFLFFPIALSKNMCYNWYIYQIWVRVYDPIRIKRDIYGKEI